MKGPIGSRTYHNDLIDQLKACDYIKTDIVEQVFRAVYRADYMFPSDFYLAHQDSAWIRGLVQLSAPSIYSEVLEGLELQEGQSFLNLGSGTGYLSTMAGLILGSQGTSHGIEIHDEVLTYANLKLHEFMSTSPAVDEFDFCEPKFILGNALSLRPNTVRYDRVYCGAGCPPDYASHVQQLIKVGGILVMPLGHTLLKIWRVSETEWESRVLIYVSFGMLIKPDNATPAPPLPECRPASLQVLARACVRRSVRGALYSRHAELARPPARPLLLQRRIPTTEELTRQHEVAFLRHLRDVQAGVTLLVEPSYDTTDVGSLSSSADERHDSDDQRNKTDDERHQSDDERHQSDVEQHQSDEERHQSDDERHQSDVEQHQSDEERHQSDDERHQSDVEQHQSDEERHQSDSATWYFVNDAHQAADIEMTIDISDKDEDTAGDKDEATGEVDLNGLDEDPASATQNCEANTNGNDFDSSVRDNGARNDVQDNVDGAENIEAAGDSGSDEQAGSDSADDENEPIVASTPVRHCLWSRIYVYNILTPYTATRRNGRRPADRDGTPEASTSGPVNEDQETDKQSEEKPRNTSASEEDQPAPDTDQTDSTHGDGSSDSTSGSKSLLQDYDRRRKSRKRKSVRRARASLEGDSDSGPSKRSRSERERAPTPDPGIERRETISRLMHEQVAKLPLPTRLRVYVNMCRKFNE